jgi:8-amino-7-oxononanoate synthase
LSEFCEEVISDEYNHASLIDGIRLSTKPKKILPHNTWKNWEPSHKPTLLVSESLYSMDGDTVDPVLFEKISAQDFLLLDESHAAGVMADAGRGLSEGSRNWDRMAVIVTFGKAFGVSGGALLAHSRIKETIINAGRSFIYSTAPSPILIPYLQESLRLMTREGEALRAELWGRAVKLRKLLSSENISPFPPSLWDQRSPIIPILIPGNDNALRIAEGMRKFGYEVKPIRYPTVPLGKERIRFSLSLSVSWEQAEKAMRHLIRLCKEYL